MDLGCSYHMCQKKEYFESLKLEEDGDIQLNVNKAYKVHVISTVRLKMFYDCEFLLLNAGYAIELITNLLSIRMFDDIDYCTRFEHEMLKIFHGGFIMAKWSKMCGLCILDGSMGLVLRSYIIS